MTTEVGVEMRDEEMRNNEKSAIEMIRKKLEEWGIMPYQFRSFNKDEAPNWRPRTFTDDFANRVLDFFYEICKDYESFNFSIEPMVVGKLKHCSYSELQKITDFKTKSLIQNTLFGRLFHGTIGEGSEERPAIIKTWDFRFHSRDENAGYLNKFCDEIELFTDERANTHPNLVKLYGYCFDRRLAVVYDEPFTRVLSDVLLADDFGWDERMKVATQLADLWAWLHEKGIAVGCVTAECIMVDDELKIKVFDFGYLSNHVNEDSKIRVQAIYGREAPEVARGVRTMKSDIYIFGLLLLQLIAKKKFDLGACPGYLKGSVVKEAKLGKKYLVHECFKEVDHPHAFAITLLAFLCIDFDPDKRPSMKDVLDALKAMGVTQKKRKRDENDAE